MCNSPKRYAAMLGLASALATTAFVLPAAADELEVRIVNLTRGQVFSPVIAWSHKRGFEPFFELGKPASDELRKIAEDGDVTDMAALLAGDPDVADIATGTGGIPPGGEEILTLEATGSALSVSLASMLVNTNDTFFAVRGADARKGEVELFSPGFDAGTEANNENCAFVPGPACPQGSGNARATDDAEGYIFVQPGIHGTAGGVATSELDPSLHDWRNPVAYIEITRKRR
ncbi:MAG: spondin domain-containing protein [Alphaproteobacteria bacterium]